jgi:hypothetical protein
VVPRQVFGCSGIVLVLELELVVVLGGSGVQEPSPIEVIPNNVRNLFTKIMYRDSSLRSE